MAGTQTMQLSKQATKTLTAVAKFLKPLIAKDVKLDPRFMIGVTRKNFHASRPMIAKAISKQVRPALAQDSNLEGIHKLLDSLDPDAMDKEDPATGLLAPSPIPIQAGGTKEQPSDVDGQDDDPVHGHIREYMSGKGMSDDDVNGLLEHLKGKKAEDEAAVTDMEDDAGGEGEDKPPPFEGKPEVGRGPPGKDNKFGKDKRMGRDEVTKAIKVAADETRKTVIKEQRAINEAEKYVRPWTGELQGAFDSADEVYKHALTALGVKGLDTVHPSAYRPLLDAHPKPGATRQQTQTTVAQDEATASDYAKMFPGAERIEIHG